MNWLVTGAKSLRQCNLRSELFEPHNRFLLREKIVQKKYIGWLLLLSLSVGCGEESPTEKVAGTVTLDGKPVEAASVTFLPDDQTTGKPAAGLTDEDGNFTLTTFAGGDGALPGSYTIQVSKFETEDGGQNPYGDPAEKPAEPATNKKLTEEEEMALMEQGYAEDFAAQQRPAKSKPAKNLLPSKYAKTSTSGLTYTVVEGENTVPLELASR